MQPNSANFRLLERMKHDLELAYGARATVGDGEDVITWVGWEDCLRAGYDQGLGWDAIKGLGSGTKTK